MIPLSPTVDADFCCCSSDSDERNVAIDGEMVAGVEAPHDIQVERLWYEQQNGGGEEAQVP